MRVPTTTGGRLHGPPPIRHQPRRINIVVDSVPGGKLRVSTPQARGWAVVVRGPDQLARAVGQAFTEAAVASYAKWHAQRYDLDKLTSPDDPTEPAVTGARGGSVTGRRPVTSEQISYGRRRAVRPDQAHPGHWTPLADGAWQSPAGRRYTSERIVGPLVAARIRLGLPITAVAEQARRAS